MSDSDRPPADYLAKLRARPLPEAVQLAADRLVANMRSEIGALVALSEAIRDESGADGSAFAAAVIGAHARVKASGIWDAYVEGLDLRFAQDLTWFVESMGRLDPGTPPLAWHVIKMLQLVVKGGGFSKVSDSSVRGELNAAGQVFAGGFLANPDAAPYAEMMRHWFDDMLGPRRGKKKAGGPKLRLVKKSGKLKSTSKGRREGSGVRDTHEHDEHCPKCNAIAWSSTCKSCNVCGHSVGPGDLH